MSELYDRIESLCKERNTTITEMCRASGASRGSLTDLKMGRISSLSTETLSKISDYLGVYVSYLLGQSSNIQCEECGLQYDLDDKKSVEAHKRHHAAWEKAVDKFGFCWTPRYREDSKAEARRKIKQDILDDDQHIEAQLTIFKALFSRSLEGCDYNPKHVSFNDYVAMMLNQEQWKNEIPHQIYMKMSATYGTKSGIPAGSYFKTEKAPTLSDERKFNDPDINMIARAGKKMTPEQRENLRKYAQYMYPEAFKDDDT